MDWHVNLLDEEKKRRRVRLMKTAFFVCAAIAVVAGTTYLSSVLFSPPYTTATANQSFFSKLKRIFPSSERRLKGERSDRVNILLLGMGGPGHDGPHLTDTIILASVRPSDGTLALLSIPRDLTVTIPEHGVNKINHANAFGEASAPRGGLELARATLATALGQTIHYVVRVDFDGFKQMIDTVGGVEVYVERAFEDPRFPLSPKGTTHLSFAVGRQHMDGETALRYARSRHGGAGEGSDFARARRQQQVLVALRDKVLSGTTLLNPLRIGSLLETLRAHIAADAELWEMVRFVDIAQRIAPQKIKKVVLSPAAGGLLTESLGAEGYFLLPRTGDFGEIKELTRTMLTAEFAQTAAPIDRTPNVVILNGTFKAGIAAQLKVALEEEGIAVAAVGNTEERSVPRSRVYVRHGAEDPYLAGRVAKLAQAPLAFEIPEAVANDAGVDASIVIVIGMDHPLYENSSTTTTTR